MNSQKFARRINAVISPCAQYQRSIDGVRGLFSCSHCRRGALIAKIPLAACIHSSTLTSSVVPNFSRFYQTLFRRRYPSHQESTFGTSLQLDSTASSEDSPGGIVSFSMKPFEATLTFCLALHYYKGVLQQRCGPQAAKTFLPQLFPLSALNEWFFSSIPVQRIDLEGLESPFSSSMSGHSSQELHSCIEQIASGMFDFFMDEFATENLRRYLDASGEDDLRSSFIAAIYAVRSRSLHIPVVGGTLGRPRGHRWLAQSQAAGHDGTQAPRNRRRSDAERLAIVAPVISLMNHSSGSAPSVATVISASEQCVVVRALRDIHRGEELTLDYKSLSIADEHTRLALHPEISLEEQHMSNEQLAWESRFQIPTTF
jgi:hypothetical protein